MSPIEVLVILFGLLLGYWLLARLGGERPNTDSDPTGAQAARNRLAYEAALREATARNAASRSASGGISKALPLLIGLGAFGKFLLPVGSMLLAIGTYALIYGWPYAVGFVLLLLVHELGHYTAARRRGLPVGLPTFIPFMGAWIDLKARPMDAETEAFVGLAGPMVGSAAAFVCYLIALSTGERMFLALAYAGFMLNLFNLIPVSPLDGGRIMAAISPRLWFVGLPMLVAVFFWQPSPIIVLIAVFAIPQIWSVFVRRKLPSPDYYRVPARVRIGYAIDYTLLVGFLLVLSIQAHDALRAVRA